MLSKMGDLNLNITKGKCAPIKINVARQDLKI